MFGMSLSNKSRKIFQRIFNSYFLLRSLSPSSSITCFSCPFFVDESFQLFSTINFFCIEDFVGDAHSEASRMRMGHEKKQPIHVLMMLAWIATLNPMQRGFDNTIQLSFRKYHFTKQIIHHPDFLDVA